MKYLHIFWHNEIKFTFSFSQVINTNLKFFIPSDHFLVTPHPLVYEKISVFSNTELFITNSLTKIINRYQKNFDIVILHKMDYFTPLRVGRQLAKKIVWRTWGIDIPSLKTHDTIKDLCKKFYTMIIRYKIRSFNTLGCANIVDIYNATQIYGKTNTKIFPYFSSGDANLWMGYQVDHSIQDTLNIMIGHSGWSYDAHLEVLKSLRNFYSEKIKLFIPLSYGNADYIACIKNELRCLDIPKDKVIVIEEFMPSEQYAKLISQMDIAIFAGIGSYALGNLTMLSHFRTKLYFKRNGVIANTLLSQNIQPNYSDDIENMKYEEFILRDEEQIEGVRRQLGRVMTKDEKMQTLKDLLQEALRKAK
jgi:hypothetical protein